MALNQRSTAIFQQVLEPPGGTAQSAHVPVGEALDRITVLPANEQKLRLCFTLPCHATGLGDSQRHQSKPRQGNE
jgi:hypothetical protein